jgi:hypothetical protein
MNVGTKILTASDIHDVTTLKTEVLGSPAMSKDGRRYRYAKNGAVALAAGATVIPSATAAYVSTAKGVQKVSASQVLTNGTVSGANTPLYEDSILTVAGAKYLANGVAQDGTIALEDRLDRSVPNTTATSLAANQFCGVTASATNPIGTAEVAVPAGAYFWAFVSA